MVTITGPHGNHSLGNIITAAVSAAVLLITMAMTFVAHRGKAKILRNSTVGISDGHYLEVTPSVGCALSLWIVLYVWQLVWQAYGLSCLGRRGEVGGYVYNSPCVLTIWIYAVYMVSNVLTIGWLFLWDRSFLVPALIFLVLLTVSLYVCVYLTCWSVCHHQGTMLKSGSSMELWMLIGFVQNGLAFYATWISFLMLHNLSTCISYTGSLAQHKSSTICLALFAVGFILWFLLDILLVDRFVRFVVTPYLVVVWILSGIIARNYMTGNANSIFSAVLLAVSMAILVAKVILLVWRCIQYPLHVIPIEEVSVHSGYDVKMAPHEQSYQVQEYEDKSEFYKY